MRCLCESGEKERPPQLRNRLARRMQMQQKLLVLVGTGQGTGGLGRSITGRNMKRC